MKNINEEDILLSMSRPNYVKPSISFTDKVMKEVINQAEISSSLVRTMNVNTSQKETWIMNLKKQPVSTLILLALVTAISVSGVAYAAYQLWPKPETHTSSSRSNETGRLELTAELKNCEGGMNSETRYELKKNATITKDQIPQVVQAQCELLAIQTWAKKNGTKRL